jgi:hypothetical protein
MEERRLRRPLVKAPWSKLLSGAGGGGSGAMLLIDEAGTGLAPTGGGLGGRTLDISQLPLTGRAPSGGGDLLHPECVAKTRGGGALSPLVTDPERSRDRDGGDLRGGLIKGTPPKEGRPPCE